MRNIMVKTYRKGYVAERELVHNLYSRGWAVLRSPRSGRMSIPLPDIIAIKKGRIVSFEVKSRELGFSLRKEQYDELLEWKRRSGSEVYLAIKIPRKGWGFLSFDDIPDNMYIGKNVDLLSIEDID